MQTTPGKLAIVITFAFEIRYFVPEFLSILQLLMILAAVTFLPSYRRFILAVSPLLFLMTNGENTPLVIVLRLAITTLGIVLFWCVRRWPRSRFAKSPISYLLLAFTLLIASACFATPLTLWHKLVWTSVGVVAAYVWFIAYALTDRTANVSNDTSIQIASFRPLWGATNVPLPKGAAYLRRIEARDEEQLAIVQLKGLKLLAWAILLSLLSIALTRFFHGFLRIPTAAEALTMSVQRTPVAWSIRWESQILSFFESILSISVLGHRIIGCCRLAGFNALRNTYRPLSSVTVAEFFNRYYYYFKELLVDFFFYPTFFYFGRAKMKLRLTLSTFAAAFVGNAFFHFTRDWPIIRDCGLKQALSNFQVYLFYCLVLSTALTVSQLRARGPRRTGFIRGRLLPAIGVGLFFCLLDIFGSTQRNYPLIEHFRYLASLFWIRM